MGKEQIFRSPGFFEREIDLSERQQPPLGIPAGVIGTATKGPAFVPVTVGSFADFVTRLGNLNPEKFGPYAAERWLANQNALTFLRMLGAGANKTPADINKTTATGQVKNAGFVVTGTVGPVSGQHLGAVQFLAATHTATTNEVFGMPFISNNDSFSGADANLIRAVVFLASDARMIVIGGDEATDTAFQGGSQPDDVATLNASSLFKLVISSSAGSSYSNDDCLAGLRVLTASLNPTNPNYIAKIMNTNPQMFELEKHLLYMDLAVDAETAAVSLSGSVVGVLSGSADTSSNSGDATMTFRDMYGHYDTRFKTPRTPMIISQPFGAKEYDLFQVASRDDGAYANKRVKVSFANIKASADPANEFGTFTLQVRDFDDTDINPVILESYDGLTMDKSSEKYVARAVGDKNVWFNFDAEEETERRLVIQGKFPNVSQHIRIVLSTDIDNGNVPDLALPFGFRGPEMLKTNDGLTDTPPATGEGRLGIVISDGGNASALTGSIVPPIPFRYKVTKGATATSGPPGNPGSLEVASADLYWGVKFERNTVPLNPNINTEANSLLASLTQFAGIRKLDAVVTGSSTNTFNNNKFTLARVALRNTDVSELTGSANEHMLDAAYIRDGQPDNTEYKVNDGFIGNRITLGTLLAQTSSLNFNKFARYNKFNVYMLGGFDGLNILDKNAALQNDRGTSTETGGGANTSFTSPGLANNVAGTGLDNNNVASYRSAINIMSDEFTVNTKLLGIPGIRDSFVTDFAADQQKSYGLAMYVMDIPSYDDNTARLYDDATVKPAVEKVVSQFEARAVDNNYAATYWPDVEIDDSVNNQRVKVPASIAAFGALAFNDRVAYPWFAPAGFNRAGLDFVQNVDVRLNKDDRNDLYDARINPIATFPRAGFVIHGQKTLQQAKSALDRVNVRRLLVEVKRIVSSIARNLTFEPNDPQVRSQFRNLAGIQLGLIQAQSGIESFRIVMDSSNNTQADIEQNKLNGRIVVVPTRAIEFIAIDFIITNAGVEFV